MDLNHHYEDVFDYQLHYVEASPDKDSNETIVFLHGFPEYWASWQEQLRYFAQKYRVIAPDLLGYNLSSKPEDDGVYQVPNLLKIYAQFIQQISRDRSVILVAHDWGGAIAWPLVAFYPHLFSKLVILNAAHPSTFTREMITNAAQRAKSSYIHDMIADDGVNMAEANDFAFFKSMVFENEESVDITRLAGYRKAWSQPGAVNAMLAYYRSMPQLAAKEETQSADGPLIATSDMKIPQIRIEIPTLVLWGEQDKAFVPELLDGLEEYVPDLTVKKFPTATHWLQHEKPEEVNREISAFINN